MGMANQDDVSTGAGIAAGTLIDGRYRVVRPIGQGGNGMVHEVEHLMTGRHLALKSLLDETGLARLEQEARASALMKNAHAVKITDMGTQGPAGPYLVMELLDGQSLRELLDEAGQLPLELTMNIIVQICECLNEAHALGIIHRDLKPENVFLCASPWPGQYDVKVLDFGIVKIEGTAAIPKSSLTRTGSTVGTPYYMSLEQLRNSSAVDTRADIYSLGVVLYESLSGRKPFQAETIGDLVYALCSGPPTHLGRLRPDLPGEVCDLVMKTLSMNRDDRPATMADLATSLLPHGNPAFGMWLRTDRPTASGPSPVRVAPPPSTPPIPATHAIGGRSPMPSMTQAVPFGTPEAMLGRGPLPSVPSAAVRTAPLGFGNAPSNAAQPTGEWPAAPPTPAPHRPAAPPSAPSRRDTPTEMYVKDAHGLVLGEAPPGPSNQGDRDTPTRAFRTDGAGFDGEQSTTAPFAAVTDAAIPQAPAPLPSAPTNLVSTGMSLPRVPVGPLQGSGIPAPTFGGGAPLSDPANPSSMITGPLPRHELAPGAPGAVNKPEWQVALDGMLKQVEQLVEETVRKVKGAPQSTQIALIIAAGGAILLLFSLILLVTVR